MGIPSGSKTINIEKRYSNLIIHKDMNSYNANVYIEVDTGYYGNDGEWTVTDKDTISFSGEALMEVMSVAPERLNLQSTNFGVFLDTLIYAIVTGDVPVTSVLTINTTADEEPVHTSYVIYDQQGRQAAYGRTYEPNHLPLIRNATIVISADGFEPVELTGQELAGEVSLDVELTPVEYEAPEEEEPEEEEAE